MPGLLEVVDKIVGVWLLIVSCLKETEKTTLEQFCVIVQPFVLALSLFAMCLYNYYPCLEEGFWRLDLRVSEGTIEVSSVSSDLENIIVDFELRFSFHKFYACGSFFSEILGRF